MGIGAYQDDAIQKITGSFGSQNMSTGIGATVWHNGVFKETSSPNTGSYDSLSQAQVTNGVRVTTFDSSLVVRTSPETRSKATRFALRLTVV